MDDQISDAAQGKRLFSHFGGNSGFGLIFGKAEHQIEPEAQSRVQTAADLRWINPKMFSHLLDRIPEFLFQTAPDKQECSYLCHQIGECE